MNYSSDALPARRLPHDQNDFIRELIEEQSEVPHKPAGTLVYVNFASEKRFKPPLRRDGRSLV